MKSRGRRRLSKLIWIRVELGNRLGNKSIFNYSYSTHLRFELVLDIYKLNYYLIINLFIELARLIYLA